MKKSEAILYFGNQIKLARYIGVSKSLVSKWGDTIPAVWAYRLEKLTDGKLKADDPWLSKIAA